MVASRKMLPCHTCATVYVTSEWPKPVSKIEILASSAGMNSPSIQATPPAYGLEVSSS